MSRTDRIWGTFIPQGVNQEYAGWDPATAWARTLEIAALAERLGYAEVWATDCVDTQPRRSAELVFDSWMTLTGVAGVTSTTRLGNFLPSAPYHHPGVLAKRAACMDVISGGRAILAVDSGRHPSGYETYGFSPPADGPAILDEHRRALRALWSEKQVDFTGEHVTLWRAHSQPQPVHGHVPTLLAGHAATDDLELAARTAEAVLWQGSPDEVAAARGALRDAAERIGRDPDEIGTAVSLECRIFDDNDARDKWLGDPRVIIFWSTHPDNYCERNLVGTVDTVTGRVQRYLDAGVDRTLVWFRDFPETASLEAFMTRVVPQVSTPALV